MIGKAEDMPVIPAGIVDLVKGNKYFGRMNDPSGSAYIKGACGDEMEFYIIVENDRLTDVKFYTDGCVYTAACGAVASALAIGKPLEDALGISTKQVIGELKVLPKSYAHCAILAVSALYKAIADYLLKP